MLTVLWNHHGFHIVTMLPPKASFNTSWLIDGNLISLFDKFFQAVWTEKQRKLVVYIDNVPVHNSRMTQDFFGHNPLKKLQHPSYSPDISLSDFYLFGKVESALIGREIPNEIDLLEVVTEIWNRISGPELHSAFPCWIARVENGIDPVSFWIDSFIVSLIIYSTPSNCIDVSSFLHYLTSKKLHSQSRKFLNLQQISFNFVTSNITYLNFQNLSHNNTAKSCNVYSESKCQTSVK
jgi:hypothetical protein